MNTDNATCFFMMVSFEPRSLNAFDAFIKTDAENAAIKCVALNSTSSKLSENIDHLKKSGLSVIAQISPSSSKDLWTWVWDSVREVKGRVIVDATCFTRETLCMLLFALSVRRNYLDRIEIQYVLPGPRGYATQDFSLPENDRWLSNGVVSIRSIIGYPGDFRNARERRVIALAGHEMPRMLEAIEYLEPTKLHISNEQNMSSTVAGAATISETVAAELRQRIEVPELSDIAFWADSIEATYESLLKAVDAHIDDNIAIIPMNTKLSTIGAAIVALQRRSVRLMYAVPEKYNELYSADVGELRSFDITKYIKATDKIPTSD